MHHTRRSAGVGGKCFNMVGGGVPWRHLIDALAAELLETSWTTLAGRFLKLDCAVCG